MTKQATILLMLIRKMLVTFGLMATICGIALFLLNPNPQSLLETKVALFVHYSDLLENRINLISLTKLDPQKKEFTEEKAVLIHKIRETNEKGLKDLDSTPTQTLINPFIWTKPLIKEHKRILIEQKDLVEQIETTDNTLKNVFLYNPSTDLGTLNPLEEEEEVLKRINAAIKGLDNVRDKKLCVDHLEPEIVKTQGSLHTLSENLIRENLNQVIKDFDNLRGLALKCELEIIYSQKSITLLVDQTNLLIKYKRALKKIDNAQTILAEKTLRN